MRALPAALSVFGPQGLVGTLYPTEPLGFAYAAAWIDAGGSPLHPSIPVVAGIVFTPYVAAFFENLLPEGEQRRMIGLREQVTSVFGLLARVGGDSAGAYTLLPEGEQPQAPVYQPLTWDQVRALVHADSARPGAWDDIEAAAQGMPAPRMSISGAQFKVLLYLDADQQPFRPMGSAPSTHILKPDILRRDIPIFASSVNETIIMRAASRCGLNTAHASYQPVAQACLVERYDRQRQGDGSLLRIWQADFCQLLGKQSDVKYEHDGGPSFVDCYALLATSVRPAVDRLQLLRWLFFNLCTGNNDSHAKNLSMLAAPGGLRLAPFYDLMCTRVYAGLGAHFAFTVAGESEPGKIGKAHIAALAVALGVTPRYLQTLARTVAQQVEQAIPAAAAEILPGLAAREQVLAQRLVQKITSLSKKMHKRLSE